MNSYACGELSNLVWWIGSSESRPLAHERVNPPSDQARDVELLRRISQGDGGAFAQFYDQYAKLLYSLALKIISDPKEAEDVLQEVFIQIWSKAGNYDARLGCAASWAVILTRNKAIDHVRAAQRRGHLLECAATEAVPVASQGGATGNEAVCGREQAELIRNSVLTLPEEQRAPIELAFFAGLTHNEIAQRLQQPPGTIKARIRRGLSKLRDALGGIL